MRDPCCLSARDDQEPGRPPQSCRWATPTQLWTYTLMQLLLHLPYVSLGPFQPGSKQLTPGQPRGTSLPKHQRSALWQGMLVLLLARRRTRTRSLERPHRAEPLPPPRAATPAALPWKPSHPMQLDCPDRLPAPRRGLSIHHHPRHQCHLHCLLHLPTAPPAPRPPLRVVAVPEPGEPVRASIL